MASAVKVTSSTPARIDFSEPLIVLVGPEKKSFIVHKDVICRRSPFLKAAIAERWNSTGDCKKIELPADNPSAFASYLQCVYQGVVVHEAGVMEEDATCELIALYALADKFGDLRGANLAIDALIQHSDTLNRIPGLAEVDLAYGHTTANSPLRKLLVDYYLHEGNEAALQSDIDQYPCAFLADFIMEYARLKYSKLPEKVEKVVFNAKIESKPKCEYHQHSDTHPVCDGEAAGGQAEDHGGDEAASKEE
ncbi:hypothetical protein LTR85_001120 [Meristemomyces frigidus]|nr:hypothetical protein LTR85_001120 [Meristemomyces frigidus]